MLTRSSSAKRIDGSSSMTKTTARSSTMMRLPLGSIRPRARGANSSLYQATARNYGTGSLTGNETRNTVPWGAFAAAERRPPCASTIERLIDKPTPSPSALVV